MIIKNLLYISGDGVTRPKNKWKVYFNHFDIYSKNYFIAKAFKSLINESELLNFSHNLRHPNYILYLESKNIPGSTFLRIKTKMFIDYCIYKIIIWKIKSNSYDLIIFSDNLFFINKRIMIKLKNISSSKIILLSGISPKHLLTDRQKECTPYFDIIFISDPGHEVEWKKYGAQAVLCLPISAGAPMTFQDILSKYNSRKKYDIVFVGRLDMGANEYRIKILNFLLTRGIDIKIWTWSESNKFIEKYPLLKKQVIGSAYGEKMIQIIGQSKIVLNIHDPSVPKGGNMRLFEIPSAKSLQIADKYPNDWFIDGEEIVLYNDNEDLLKKINYYLKFDDERNRISKNGYKRVTQEHRFKHRVEKLLKCVHDL